jgi:hypothetical protein
VCPCGAGGGPSIRRRTPAADVGGPRVRPARPGRVIGTGALWVRQAGEPVRVRPHPRQTHIQFDISKKIGEKRRGALAHSAGRGPLRESPTPRVPDSSALTAARLSPRSRPLPRRVTHSARRPGEALDGLPRRSMSYDADRGPGRHPASSAVARRSADAGPAGMGRPIAVLRGSARFCAVLRGSARLSMVLRGSARFCAVLRGSASAERGAPPRPSRPRRGLHSIREARSAGLRAAAAAGHAPPKKNSFSSLTARGYTVLFERTVRRTHRATAR